MLFDDGDIVPTLLGKNFDSHAGIQIGLDIVFEDIWPTRGNGDQKWFLFNKGFLIVTQFFKLLDNEVG